MKDCKCGNACASNAKSCPNCGYRFTSTFTKLGLVLIVLIVVRIVSCDHSHNSNSAAYSSPASSPAPTVDAKELLIQSVKLDSKVWGRMG
jgi:hypothetical protein